MTDESVVDVDRRTVLRGLAGVCGAVGAGCSALRRDADGRTSLVAEDRARELATRFAPTLYFDAREPWFPTDPRPYASERDGETVVDGFDALDGYHRRSEAGDPPDPTVFYRAVEYEGSPLVAVQFWFYSVFDQFTTNFHWHDWEVLHVFVDVETGEPQLYVASSHSRTVPNNEFLDPDPEQVPRILSELGSHSSALSVNEVPDRFQRVAIEDLLADVTNATVEGVADLPDLDLPIAYGLPRDEGSRLPYLVPAYEGDPIYEHDRLPSVTRESLIDPDLTVRSLDAVTSPPTDLPARETGLDFRHRERDGDAAVEYDLVPAAEIEHIEAFVGPQLRFEFEVPDVLEDAIADHITATETPWDQARYENPAADITAPNHRAALADRYDAVGDPAPVDAVVGRITEAVAADDAPADEGLTTIESGVESVVLLESDPEVAPTFRGIAVLRDVPAGDHRLTVNGVGRAPHSERVAVPGDGTATAVGVDGEIPLVARDRATKVEVRGENAAVDLAAVALEDDFAGRLYESPVDGNDAVYVHAGGAYTLEVRDGAEAVGAYRINPDTEGDPAIRIDRPDTGKEPLSTFVADIAEETRGAIDARGGPDETGGRSNAVVGLERALAAVVEAARAAADRARAGESSRADRHLETVAERLRRAADRLADAEDDLPDPLSNAARRRLEQADRRAGQARNADRR